MSNTKRFTSDELRKQSRYWANVAATTGAYTYEVTAAMLRQAADDAEAVERLEVLCDELRDSQSLREAKLAHERDEARATARRWHKEFCTTEKYCYAPCCANGEPMTSYTSDTAIIASWPKD